MAGSGLVHSGQDVRLVGRRQGVEQALHVGDDAWGTRDRPGGPECRDRLGRALGPLEHRHTGKGQALGVKRIVILLAAVEHHAGMRDRRRKRLGGRGAIALAQRDQAQ